MSARRYLALALPCLPTDRLARIDPALAGVPFALWTEAGNRRLLSAVNFLAARHLAPGTPLADATAMVPALVTRAADPLADAALLHQLARWATRYTPLAAVDGTDALVLDILGCAHRFGASALPGASSPSPLPASPSPAWAGEGGGEGGGPHNEPMARDSLCGTTPLTQPSPPIRMGGEGRRGTAGEGSKAVAEEGSKAAAREGSRAAAGEGAAEQGSTAEAALLHDATRRLNQAGFTVHAAIAETAAAALALARAGQHGAVVPAGETLAAIAPLPIAVLGLDAALCLRLEQFGIASIGALAAQPRAALSRRVGPAARALLDVALGRAPRPIRPLLTTPDFSVAENFAEPILTAEAIGRALDRLMHALCGQLEKAGQGARRVTLACFRSDGQVARAGIGTGLASRDEKHLARLLRPRIETIDPGFGIDRIVLDAEAVEALGTSQPAFTDGISARAARRAELAQLLDRLRGRLGAPAVHRLALRESHVPERAVLPIDPQEDTPMPQLTLHRPRPVRLFVPAEPISVVSLLPDGPPRRFRWRDRVIAVSRAEGPERIAPEWWRDDAATARDYWRVEAEEGGRAWLYRDQPARWFLHGLFG
jgi:protein ImuB